MINAPTSIVGHDDLEMYERAQEGLLSDGLEWVNLQRLMTEEEDYSTESVDNGTTERQMRNQFAAWTDFIKRSIDNNGENHGNSHGPGVSVGVSA